MYFLCFSPFFVLFRYHEISKLRRLDGVDIVVEDGVVYAQQAPASWGLDRVDQRNLPLDNSFNPPGK